MVNIVLPWQRLQFHALLETTAQHDSCPQLLALLGSIVLLKQRLQLRVQLGPIALQNLRPLFFVQLEIIVHTEHKHLLHAQLERIVLPRLLLQSSAPKVIKALLIPLFPQSVLLGSIVLLNWQDQSRALEERIVLKAKQILQFHVCPDFTALTRSSAS